MEILASNVLGFLLNKAGAGFITNAGKLAAEHLIPKPLPSVVQKEILPSHVEYFDLIPPNRDANHASRPLSTDAFHGLYGTELQIMALLKYGHYFSEVYQRFCLELSQNPRTPHIQFVILSGPSGTGKTEHAKRLGKALGYYLLNVEPANLQGGPGEISLRLKKLQSEYLTSEMFRNAVVLFDEFDHFLQDTSAQSQFRQFIEAPLQDTECRVLVIATTNCLGSIPADIRSRAEIIEFQIPSKSKPFRQFWQQEVSSSFQRLQEPPPPRFLQWELSKEQYRDLLLEKLVKDSRGLSFRTLSSVIKLTNLTWFQIHPDGYPTLRDYLATLRKIRKQTFAMAKL